ncbi:hypothetical protein JGU66_20660 [Myxococcaceae bacterium JPH2]|nr:hypothetical protein [Myxococcaceae bacterium JPH2]
MAVLISHEEQGVRPDGVTQVLRYQERVLRRDGHLWSERVLDGRVPAVAHSESRRDVHDWSVVPRWVSREADGRVRLRFVLADSREVVEVEPPEYDSVGFTPAWDELSHQVSNEVLARLTPSTRPDAPEGARWLEATTADRYIRVLWSDKLALALEMESGRKDGTALHRAKVQLESLPATAPWESTRAFARKDINDYRD